MRVAMTKSLLRREELDILKRDMGVEDISGRRRVKHEKQNQPRMMDLQRIETPKRIIAEFS